VKPVIEVVVSSAGDILIDAIGFKGADCEKATRFLEEALGVCRKRQRKPDYHQNVTQPSKQRIGQ
jgi:hypothetical protein